MISREHRFHGQASLRYVYTKGQTIRGPLFLVKAVLNQRQSSYRAAVVVSRKVNKSAVIRNRIRRRIYEAIGALSGQIVEPYDIVVTVFHDSVAELDISELKGQLKSQLKSVGVLAKTSTD